MARVEHGDLYWIDLPDRGGREQRGRRPALIWQDTIAFPLPTVLVIPFTTRLDARRFGATAPVQPTASNGLAAPSVALIFQPGSWDVVRLRGRISRLDDPDLQAVADMARRLQRL